MHYVSYVINLCVFMREKTKSNPFINNWLFLGTTRNERKTRERGKALWGGAKKRVILVKVRFIINSF